MLLARRTNFIRSAPQFKKGSVDGIDYDGPVTTEDLIRFLKKEGGVHIGLAGTLQDFDEFAAQFKKGDKPSILAKAEAKLAGLSGEQKVSADHYIKVCRTAVWYIPCASDFTT